MSNAEQLTTVSFISFKLDVFVNPLRLPLLLDVTPARAMFGNGEAIEWKLLDRCRADAT